MSEENKVVEPQNQQTEATSETVETKAKEMTFTQEQLDNIIKSRLDSEQKKHQRMLDEDTTAVFDQEQFKKFDEYVTKKYKEFYENENRL